MGLMGEMPGIRQKNKMRLQLKNKILPKKFKILFQNSMEIMDTLNPIFTLK